MLTLTTSHIFLCVTRWDMLGAVGIYIYKNIVHLSGLRLYVWVVGNFNIIFVERAVALQLNLCKLLILMRLRRRQHIYFLGYDGR